MDLWGAVRSCWEAVSGRCSFWRQTVKDSKREDMHAVVGARLIYYTIEYVYKGAEVTIAVDLCSNSKIR